MAELRREWGADLHANLGYARAFANQVADENPQFGDLIDAELARAPDLWPAVLRIAARMGREGRHGDPETVAKLLNQETTMEKPNAGDEKRLEALTRDLNIAFAKGDKDRARELAAQRDRLAEKLYGDEPIVGSGGRTL